MWCGYRRAHCNKQVNEFVMNHKLKAITTFTDRFKGSFTRLSESDVDFRVYDGKKSLIAYIEVVETSKTLKDCYPLKISLQKLYKLSSKRLNPVIIWSCLDGIMYAKINDVTGEVKWYGDSELNSELYVFYGKQKLFKYARYY